MAVVVQPMGVQPTSLGQISKILPLELTCGTPSERHLRECLRQSLPGILRPQVDFRDKSNTSECNSSDFYLFCLDRRCSTIWNEDFRLEL